MVVFKIDLEKSGFLQELDKKMTEVAENIFFQSQQNIVEKKIIDRGVLLQRGNINDSFLEKKIIYPVPYAESIEFGRLPGTQPPVNMLKDWVKRKGIAKNDKEINNIAWAIAKDIKKDGMMPRPFLGPAVEAELQKLRAN